MWSQSRFEWMLREVGRNFEYFWQLLVQCSSPEVWLLTTTQPKDGLSNIAFFLGKGVASQRVQMDEKLVSNKKLQWPVSISSTLVPKKFQTGHSLDWQGIWWDQRWLPNCKSRMRERKRSVWMEAVQRSGKWWYCRLNKCAWMIENKGSCIQEEKVLQWIVKNQDRWGVCIQVI